MFSDNNNEVDGEIVQLKAMNIGGSAKKDAQKPLIVCQLVEGFPDKVSNGEQGSKALHLARKIVVLLKKLNINISPAENSNSLVARVKEDVKKMLGEEK